MDNLDEKINSYERDKVISLIQENSVRIGKINIRFTKLNKKNSLERWQAYYDSYDRLLRSVPKELLRIEREVRQKFVSPFTPERIHRLKTYINEDLDLLVKKIEKECRLEFKKLGQEEDFQRRLSGSQKKYTELLESEIKKCSEKLEKSTLQSGKIQLKDLARAYQADEILLHQLNIIDPLQAINANLNSNIGGPDVNELFDETIDGIRKLIQSIQDTSIDPTATVAIKKAAKMEVAKESMQVREIILNIDYLVEQIKLSGEQKNPEVLRKIWLQLESYLENGKAGWENLIPRFKSLYDYIESKGN